MLSQPSCRPARLGPVACLTDAQVMANYKMLWPSSYDDADELFRTVEHAENHIATDSLGGAFTPPVQQKIELVDWSEPSLSSLQSHEKQNGPYPFPQIRIANRRHPFWRTLTPRCQHRSRHQYLPHFQLHVFLHTGDEGVGGRKKHRLHLYALRQSDAFRGRRKNRRS